MTVQEKEMDKIRRALLAGGFWPQQHVRNTLLLTKDTRFKTDEIACLAKTITKRPVDIIVGEKETIVKFAEED